MSLQVSRFTSVSFFTNLNLARPNRLAKKMVPVVVPVVVPPYFDRLPNMVIDIPKRKEIYNNTVLLQVLLQVLIFGPNHWPDKTQGKSL